MNFFPIHIIHTHVCKLLFDAVGRLMAAVPRKLDEKESRNLNLENSSRRLIPSSHLLRTSATNFQFSCPYQPAYGGGSDLRESISLQSMGTRCKNRPFPAIPSFHLPTAPDGSEQGKTIPPSSIMHACLVLS